MKGSNIRFLVPIDFSRQSLVALEQSYNLAKLYGAEIWLVYVLEEQSSLLKLFKKSVDDPELNQRIKEKLEFFAKDISETVGINVKSRVEKGKVYERIIETAKEINSTLIIMATSGSDSIKDKFIGTNALRVVKQAHCPVITVKGERHRVGCETILLPLDLTKETTEKVEKALELAHLFGGVEIKVVSVLKTNNPKVIANLKQQMQKVLDKIEKEEVKCVGSFIKIIKGEDSIASAIVEYAEKEKADLIMIMTQQENEPTAFFIGSEAQTIINTAETPVMSIIPTTKIGVNVF